MELTVTFEGLFDSIEEAVAEFQRRAVAAFTVDGVLYPFVLGPLRAETGTRKAGYGVFASGSASSVAPVDASGLPVDAMSPLGFTVVGGEPVVNLGVLPDGVELWSPPERTEPVIDMPGGPVKDLKL